MGLISLLFSNPAAFVVLVVPLLYAVIIHEVSHGLVALLFGDRTAQNSGRLTLNPVPHIDPLGALMLFFVGFGWARPVPVDYRNFRNFRVGLVCVAFAGCLANILMAALAFFLLRVLPLNGNAGVTAVLLVVARINIMLGAFNLIPIPPLDGSKILMGFLPPGVQREFARLEPYGFFILIILLVTGMLDPLIGFVQALILGIINILASALHL